MQETEAKFKTWVKGAAGTFGLLVMITAFYMLKGIISKKLSPWWFEMSYAEFLFKSTSYFEETNGSLNIILSVVLVLGITVLFGIVASKAQKKLSFMILCQVITVLDLALLVFLIATNHFGDVDESAWINVITHVITIIMLFSGIYASKKLKDINNKSSEVE